MKFTSLRSTAIQLTIGALLATPIALSAPAAAVSPNCSATPAAYVDLSGCDLSGRDFTDVDLSWSDLRGADLRGAILVDADLTWARLDSGADLTGADLTGATLSNAWLWCNPSNPDDSPCLNAQPAVLTNATFSSSTVAIAARFDRVDFSGLNLAGVNFSDSSLVDAEFRGTNLTGATMYNAFANGADFTGATLVDTNLSGSNINQERYIDATFSGSDLQGANLASALLTRTDMTNTDLSGANLSYARFVDAPFAGATFSDGTNHATLYETEVNRLVYSSILSGATVTDELSVVNFNYTGLTSGFNVDLRTTVPPLSVVSVGFIALDTSFVAGVELPDTLTTIEDNGFDIATLTQVVLPASLTTLRSRAFEHAFGGSESTVTFLGTPPTIDPLWPLFGFGTGRCASITCTMKILYKSGVAGWPLNLATGTWANAFPLGTTQAPIYEVSFSANGATGAPAQTSVLQTSDGGSVTLSGQGTLVRTGYSFAGWQTSGGTPVTSPYTPTANVTLVPRWSEIPGPTPEPTPSSEPTSASTPTSAPLPTPSSAPVPTELRPGRGTLVVDGQPVAVQVSPSSNARSLTISGAGVTLTLAATGPDGRPIPLAPDGSLVLSRGGSVPITGSGFAPGSTVVLYLFSEPVELGEASANADGSISVSVPVPADASTGSHTIQVVGSNASGEPLALSIGLTVKTPAAARGARPVINVSQRTVSPGSHVEISVSGVQAKCLVRVSVPGSAATSRANGAGKVQAVVAAPVKPGKWEVRARVSGRGCDAVTVKTPINVRR